MMTAGLALVTALAGCEWQGNVAGTRQVPTFHADCFGSLPGQRNEARNAPRWHNGPGGCAALAGEDRDAEWTVSAGTRASQGRTEAASGDAGGATGGAAADLLASGAGAFSGETPSGQGVTGASGGNGGSGGVGTETGSTGESGGAGTDAGGNGGSGGAGSETSGTGGSGGEGGTGGAGTGTGGTGGSGGSGTETGGTGGSGGEGQSEGAGTGTGGTGGDPVREHTGKPEDGVTGRPENVGPPPETGNSNNAGGRGRP